LSISKAFDLGLIIPLREEFDAAREVLAFGEAICEDDHYFYPFTVPGSATCGVAVVLFEPGLTNSAVAVTRLLGLADIRVLALVGIAGALDSDLRLGDVVIASSVNEYLYRARATPHASGHGFEFEHAGWSWRAGRRVVSYVRHFRYLMESCEFRAWQERARSRHDPALAEGIGPLIGENPDYSVGAIASGPVVGAAGSFSSWLRQQNRLVQAIEMEAAGAARAIYENDDADLIVIRGISDFADERKKDLDSTSSHGRSGAWRRYAAVNAFDLLATFVKLPQFPWTGPRSALPPEPVTVASPGTSPATSGSGRFADQLATDIYEQQKQDPSDRELLEPPPMLLCDGTSQQAH
jgi:nucleoside phosphorylase